MDSISLGTYKDTLLNADYDLRFFTSAKELSNNLKKTYKKLKVDFDSHNTKKDNFSWLEKDNNNTVENPPKEIYEYQNFFLLEKKNGDYILLDGFRRLLWYNAPDSQIIVKVYKEEQLTNSQILTLLVNLNHFKFYGLGSYQERGFSLLLETVFGVNITSFRDAFDAYLSLDKDKSDYGSESKSSKAKNTSVKERILNEQFVDDMKFLQELSQTNHMVNRFLGVKLFKKRQETSKVFDVKEFIQLAEENPVTADLLKKFEGVGTNSSAKSMEVVNKLLEVYDNVFTLMLGGEVEKTFAEKQAEAKELVKELKKDKNLTKLTGSQKHTLLSQ